MEIYDQRNLVFDNRFLSSCVAVENLAKEEMYTNQSFRPSFASSINWTFTVFHFNIEFFYVHKRSLLL